MQSDMTKFHVSTETRKAYEDYLFWKCCQQRSYIIACKVTWLNFMFPLKLGKQCYRFEQHEQIWLSCPHNCLKAILGYSLCRQKSLADPILSTNSSRPELHVCDINVTHLPGPLDHTAGSDIRPTLILVAVGQAPRLYTTVNVNVYCLSLHVATGQVDALTGWQVSCHVMAL